MRVGGVGIYHTDAIVRRSAPLQATSHAAVPAARVNPNTLARLGLQDGQTAIAKQNGVGVSVVVKADAGLPEKRGASAAAYRKCRAGCVDGHY